MNYINRRISHVLGSSLGAFELAAQDNDEVFELSPFTIDASSDVGYYATETLSGTQLKSSVRDLANPITILTEEFMADIGAVNYEEALEYLPSTKAYVGPQSDFDNNSGRTGAPYTTRGFRVDALTSNFFATLNVNGKLGRIDELNPRSYLVKDNMRGWTDSPLLNHEKANTTDVDAIIANDPSAPLMNWKRKSRSDGRWINGFSRQSAGFVPNLVPGVTIPLTLIPSGPSDQYDTNYGASTFLRKPANHEKYPISVPPASVPCCRVTHLLPFKRPFRRCPVSGHWHQNRRSRFR